MGKSLSSQLIAIERALFEQSFDAVLIADDNATYVHANPAAVELFRLPYDKLIGSRVFGFAPETSQEIVLVQWRAFIEQGEQSGIFDVHRPDGTVQRAAFRARANVLPGVHVSFMTPVYTLEAPNHPDGGRLLTICAWSKRVKIGEQWMAIEEFLSKQLNIDISHGISPQSAAEFFP